MNPVVAAFAESCVLAEVRERFGHELNKRPARAYERICHNTAETLQPKFLLGSVSFAPEERCLVLDTSKGFREATWAEIEKKTGLYGGLLVLSIQAPKFYAESEGSPRVQVWAGQF
jgi:hypothetical protein